MTATRRTLLAGVAMSLTFPGQVIAQTQTITGAGASFPAPLYQLWAQGSRGPIGLQVNYQSVGSGGGQNQIIARTVDFGASDAPLTPERLDSTGLLQVPTVLGAVVVVFNVPGIESNQLRLSGNLLAKIFMGQINLWNHPEIVAENPGLNLPRLAIAPIYRGDGSGTTFVFTKYLSGQSSEFSQNIGTGTSVKWLVGTGARGNEGISGTVRQLRGSIGYVESAFAKIGNIPTAMLKNKNQKYVSPTMQGFVSAANNSEFLEGNRFVVDLIDQPGDDTWPIVSATYILIPRNGDRSRLVARWIDWAFKNGNEQATRLDYVPLPNQVQSTIITYLEQQIASR